MQDCCIVHGFPDEDTVIEANGHIGHGAILHACRIRTHALVGMNAVVNDNAVIGEWAMVAALAFVKAGMEVRRARSSPAFRPRAARADPAELPWKGDATRQYQELAVRSLRTMQETTA